jgi:hypothetical protein
MGTKFPESEESESHKGVRKKMDNRPILFLVVGFAIGLILGYGADRLSEPNSYEDCVLKLMPTAKTRESAVFIRRACFNKFKESPKQALSWDDLPRKSDQVNPFTELPIEDPQPSEPTSSKEDPLAGLKPIGEINKDGDWVITNSDGSTTVITIGKDNQPPDGGSDSTQGDR